MLFRSGSDQGKRSDDVRANIERTSPDVRDPVPSRPVPISNAQNDAHFAAFWTAYPRKIAKKAARKKFDAAVKSGVDPSEIVSAAEDYAKAKAGEDAKYIAYPTTWLNQGRWEDEAETPAPKPFDLWNSGGPI